MLAMIPLYNQSGDAQILSRYKRMLQLLYDACCISYRFTCCSGTAMSCILVYCFLLFCMAILLYIAFCCLILNAIRSTQYRVDLSP